MKLNRMDALLLGTAIAIGFGVSTGHPAGIVTAAGVPFLCLAMSTRKAVFRCAFGYYLAALWPVVPGIERYLGSSSGILGSVALWLCAAILLSIPWPIGWTSRHSQFIWRAPLVLLATVLPPLGIIGVASPLTAAGYLFPGTGWSGLLAVALLPGILLSMRSSLSRLHSVALALGLCFSSHVWHSADAEPPPGWVAINMRLGDVSRPFRDFAAAQFIQQTAAASSARVLIFPEAVVPRWSEATDAFWREALNRSRELGQILAIGAGLSRQQPNSGEKLNELRAYDFSGAVELLKGGEMPALRLSVPLPNSEPIDNGIILTGAESAMFYERVPVPIGMWRPFDHSSVPIRLASTGVITIDHQRAAVLICYEQLLTLPILASMLERPTVIVAISNTFWVECTPIPRYQAAAVRGWAKLFRLPYLIAVNS